MAASPNFVVLTNFNFSNGTNPDSLAVDSAGDLFGTTVGGTNGTGMVYELAAGSSSPTLLWNFIPPTGTNPHSLVMDSAGDLFGTTQYGGANNDGIIFEIVKSASGYSAPVTISDGGVDSLSIDAAGDLFAISRLGGTSGNGAIFEFAKSGSSYSAPITLADFNYTNGSQPKSSLVLDAAGDLFGTTISGGANGFGTVYELVKTGSSYGAPVTLYSFGGNISAPEDLIVDQAGNLFGTTTYGGPDNVGTVFEMVKTGSGYSAPVTLAALTRASNGAYPDHLVMDANGDLFGTTTYGGANEQGTVFELVKSGSAYSAPVTLLTFNGLNGRQPNSLYINAAGDLIGTTYQGGLNDDGIIFKLTTKPVAPALTITSATWQGNQTTFSLSGTIDTADAGLTVSIYDGSTLLGTTTANAAGAWSANVSISGQGVQTLTAKATNTAGTGISNSVTDLSGGASAILNDGGQTVFLTGSNDAVTINGYYNTVTGSNGTIYLHSGTYISSIEPVINGGGNTVQGYNDNEFSLTGTNNNWDSVTASYAVIDLKSAQTSVSGGANTINFVSGTGNAISLSNTSVDGVDTVNGSNGTVDMNGAQASVYGGGNLVNFQSGINSVLLVNTAGTPDTVLGSGGTITLYNAAALITGSDTVTGAAGSTVLFSGNRSAYALSHNATSATVTNNSTGAIDTLTGIQTLQFADVTLPWNYEPAKDFNGDGTSDILFTNSSGTLADWTIANGTCSGWNGIGTASGWTVAGTGDFNGDGTSDVLFTNASGTLVDWTLKNGTYSGWNGIGSASGWTVAGTGDFNGDGTSDVLFQNGSGEVVDWTMKNGAFAGWNDIGNAAGWKVAGTGDFNGDGTSDILFQNGSGEVVDWTLKNGTFAGWNDIGNAAGWTVAGTGDFNGDGTTDILFQNGSGEVVDWMLKNGTFAGWNDIGNASGWTVAGTGDYGGNGTSDILFQNGSGEVVDWMLKNGAFSGWHDIGNAAGWKAG